MSSVSSIGGSSLIQLLQQLTGQTSQTSPTSFIDPQSATNTSQQTGATSGGHHHHHGGFAQKIESSVTTALQNAPAGSDPNQIIKNAITQALQQGTQGTNGSNSTGSTATSASTLSSNNTSQSVADEQFNELLSSYGVTPQQFQQDLQGALSDSQGSPNFATMFRNFPPGSFLQATG